MSRVWVDLVLRGAGHQTSLFSIMPPEIQQRAHARGFVDDATAYPPRGGSIWAALSACEVVPQSDRLSSAHAIAALWS